ncbi:DUF6615 family protein [Bosea sp. (in: a-proteobacteria)]|jgi:hypothetical protein|uniref:DUF6615 family protein n=1 Tax=Bosea sp. (in: a-proteobacteria) TaxID=1871050 RepID=UPI003569F61D
MLCRFSRRFPNYLAAILDKGEGLKRNFREETGTDLLTAGLLGLSTFGIYVDYPDEPTTGADMEWVFISPKDVGGGRYLRLLIQAKRAKRRTLKSSVYWFYDHLDHLEGKQAEALVDYAASKTAAGESTLPLYAFYHPKSALCGPSMGLPSVEGINFIFAAHVAKVVKGGCSLPDKKLDRWRKFFMPLSDFLCFPASIHRGVMSNILALSFDFDGGFTIIGRNSFHPDLVASRLLHRLNIGEATLADVPPELGVLTDIQPSNGIPLDILAAVEGTAGHAEKRRPERIRVIFVSQASSEDEGLRAAIGRVGQS